MQYCSNAECKDNEDYRYVVSGGPPSYKTNHNNNDDSVCCTCFY
jgi:hypothetical protein